MTLIFNVFPLWFSKKKATTTTRALNCSTHLLNQFFYSLGIVMAISSILGKKFKVDIPNCLFFVC